MVDQASGSQPTAGEPIAHADRAATGWTVWLAALLAFVPDVVRLTGRTLVAILTGAFSPADVVAQMSAIGVDSLWIVLVVTTATGAVFSFYTTTLAHTIGFTGLVGGTLGYAFLNELGPVLGGVAFAARAGAAIAAEIGTMVVTDQVDALRAMAVSPISYLVAPRLISAVVMLPLLILVGDVSGLTGGVIFGQLSGVTRTEFLSSMYQFVLPIDLVHGLLKALCFGYLVGIIACQQGLKTSGGATGVGRSTTSSVVLCVLLIFVADFFLAQLLAGRGAGS